MSDKRDQLLETAERLFYDEGFHATGIDRVIEKAGVARMTLYKHFPSKDALIGAVMARREQAYWQALNGAVAAAEGVGRSGLRAAIRAHGDWLRALGTNGCFFLKALGEYNAHAPSIAKAVSRHKQDLIAFFDHLLTRERVADRAPAEQIVLILEGATALAPVIEIGRAHV